VLLETKEGCMGDFGQRRELLWASIDVLTYCFIAPSRIAPYCKRRKTNQSTSSRCLFWKKVVKAIRDTHRSIGLARLLLDSL
jgi:hypothetical protein